MIVMIRYLERIVVVCVKSSDVCCQLDGIIVSCFQRFFAPVRCLPINQHQSSSLLTKLSIRVCKIIGDYYRLLVTGDTVDDTFVPQLRVNHKAFQHDNVFDGTQNRFQTQPIAGYAGFDEDGIVLDASQVCLDSRVEIFSFLLGFCTRYIRIQFIHFIFKLYIYLLRPLMKVSNPSTPTSLIFFFFHIASAVTLDSGIVVFKMLVTLGKLQSWFGML